MPASLPEDPTLDEVRAFLAPELAAQAAFDGWDEKAVLAAAELNGVDPDLARLAFNEGPVDMIDAWFQAVDLRMAAKYSAEELAAMKVRQRIKLLVEARLEAVAAEREGLRRALAILAAPPHLRRATKMGWRTADRIWRLAGDIATDYNHYTKRTLLAGIYASTISVFLDDESEDFADTRAFLDRRIENIMQFEKVKAKVTGRGGDRFSMARFVGRLRYRGV
ncbi:MAG: COQ9 family protein [Sphingomonadales bacterium]|nr:COQ9 family protein [Sphingomonadales bacterium]NCO49485.1 COQ9 family protein [Sphingomonadales bacterium]NCP01330.1 COQ9 family protein [Sphingomonadales bacterium]NCP26614.1 COQ9 family protein [Sphingomonadales bacterium]NCP43797.1 COQ9 family protein [Sphingomonadales bacterium]